MQKTKDRAAKLNMYSVNLRRKRPLRDCQKGYIPKSKLGEIRGEWWVVSGEWRCSGANQQARGESRGDATFLALFNLSTILSIFLRIFSLTFLDSKPYAEYVVSGGAEEQISKLGGRVEEMQRWESNQFGARNRKRSHPGSHVLPFSNSLILTPAHFHLWTTKLGGGHARTN